VENKNILIIDDDPAMIKLFELIAKKSGLNVVSAADGAEGLRKLNQQDFLLVITDLKMPSMNGIEFIKQARKYQSL
jgi:two-component system, chemotaxis family, chemotaxis protein CheY